MALPDKFYSMFVSDTEAFLLECVRPSAGAVSVLSMKKVPTGSLKGIKFTLPVYLILPSYGVFTHIASLVAPDANIEALAARYEARQSIPMPEHLVSTAYAVLDEGGHIIKPAVISAVKQDVIEKYVGFYLNQHNKIAGYTYGLIDFYNAVSFYAAVHRLRSGDNIILGVFAGENYVDAVILGGTRKEDVFKTIHRSNYISAIFDIKEMLEVYFARHGGVAGAVALTKGINKCVFLGHSEEARQEIRDLLAKEFSTAPVSLSLRDLDDNLAADSNDCGFVMAFGQAITVSGSESHIGLVFDPMDGGVEREMGVLEKLASAGAFGVVLAGIGIFAAGPFAQVSGEISRLEGILSQQKALRRTIARYEKQRQSLLAKLSQRSSFVEKQGLFVKAIASMASCLPGNLRITNYNSQITFNDKRQPLLNITLTGVGRSYQDINAFVQSLRNSGVFKKVVPVASRLLDGNEKVEVLVSLEM